MFVFQPLLVVIIVATALAENSCSQNSLQNQQPATINDLVFSLYLQVYGKEYCDDQEYQQRQIIFENHLKIMKDLQNQHPNTKFGLNNMSDWSDIERQQLLGFRHDLLAKKKWWFQLRPYVAQGNAPDSLDWREHGLVTGIKQQGLCGSCYVFSAIGNIEGQYAKKYNKLISLSEQQGLDCDRTDAGCHSGFPINVYNTLAQLGGSEEENAYPYKGTQEQCLSDPSKIVVKVTGGQVLQITDEETLKNALFNYGPLSIAMNFKSHTLNAYSGGIADPTDCNPQAQPNHALVLVGYGTENNTPFWIIKNSWSTNWGEAGYLRLIRGKNACSLLDNISTATVA